MVRALPNRDPKPAHASSDLAIPLPSSQAVFTQRKTQSRGVPLTQTAAAAAAASSESRIGTKCGPLDKLIGGGLPRRHVLELSGPPGTPKGAIAVGIVKAFLKDSADEEVLFLGKLYARLIGWIRSKRAIDTQNMTTAVALRRAVPANTVERVFHRVLQTLPELVAFMHTLPSFMNSHPKVP
jgi:RAD51-like protein 2